MYKNINCKFLAGIFLFFTCTFSLANNDAGKNAPHYKPGANLRFSHNYDGTSKVGEYEYIELRFTHHSSGNNELIKITLNPTDAVDITEGLHFEFTATDPELRIPITINAKQNGKHYLGIYTEVIDQNANKRSRVFELPIQVGDKTDNISLQKTRPVYTRDGRKLSILEAVERLENAEGLEKGNIERQEK